jgi:hypothetical protein
MTLSAEENGMVDLKRGNSVCGRDRSRGRDKSIPEPPTAKLRDHNVAIETYPSFLLPL